MHIPPVRGRPSTRPLLQTGQHLAPRLVAITGSEPAHQAAGLLDFPASSASFSASLHAFMECSSARLLEFVSCQVISFCVSCGCNFMGVGGKVVQLCDSIVCALWHGGLLYGAVGHHDCSSGSSIEQAANRVRGSSLHRNLLLSSESPGLYQP